MTFFDFVARYPSWFGLYLFIVCFFIWRSIDSIAGIFTKPKPEATEKKDTEIESRSAQT